MDQVPRGRHTSIVFDKDVRTITNFKYPKNRMTPNSNKKKKNNPKKIDLLKIEISKNEFYAKRTCGLRENLCDYTTVC